ncbi:hypothetical protein DFH07DRAFT_776010 [Mycena maculata]|uniref:Uncharacterized protein n=1 Tax=Mycena maculata TaxID=230809 RepID=A0AAD7N5I4_9AGAR|nr:hypothetical protein DFH07DRAFT_776010 [Mycena maculata]
MINWKDYVNRRANVSYQPPLPHTGEPQPEGWAIEGSVGHGMEQGPVSGHARHLDPSRLGGREVRERLTALESGGMEALYHAVEANEALPKDLGRFAFEATDIRVIRARDFIPESASRRKRKLWSGTTANFDVRIVRDNAEEGVQGFDEVGQPGIREVEDLVLDAKLNVGKGKTRLFWPELFKEYWEKFSWRLPINVEQDASLVVDNLAAAEEEEEKAKVTAEVTKKIKTWYNNRRGALAWPRGITEAASRLPALHGDGRVQAENCGGIRPTVSDEEGANVNLRCEVAKTLYAAEPASVKEVVAVANKNAHDAAVAKYTANLQGVISDDPDDQRIMNEGKTKGDEGVDFTEWDKEAYKTKVLDHFVRFVLAAGMTTSGAAVGAGAGAGRISPPVDGMETPPAMQLFAPDGGLPEGGPPKGGTPESGPREGGAPETSPPDTAPRRSLADMMAGEKDAIAVDEEFPGLRLHVALRGELRALTPDARAERLRELHRLDEWALLRENNLARNRSLLKEIMGPDEFQGEKEERGKKRAREEKKREHARKTRRDRGVESEGEWDPSDEEDEEEEDEEEEGGAPAQRRVQPSRTMKR